MRNGCVLCGVGASRARSAIAFHLDQASLDTSARRLAASGETSCWMDAAVGSVAHASTTAESVVSAAILAATDFENSLRLTGSLCMGVEYAHAVSARSPLGQELYSQRLTRNVPARIWAEFRAQSGLSARTLRP